MSRHCVDEIPFWVDFTENSIPKNALKAGKLGDEVLYIGRAMHERALTPGSIVPSENALYLPWGFKAHRKTDFEILVGAGTAYWIASKDGNVPENAFVAGATQNGESLFIGRVQVAEGKVIVGKIHQLYKLCYIPDIGGTKEIDCREYEVLVV